MVIVGAASLIPELELILRKSKLSLVTHLMYERIH